MDNHINTPHSNASQHKDNIDIAKFIEKTKSEYVKNFREILSGIEDIRTYKKKHGELSTILFAILTRPVQITALSEILEIPIKNCIEHCKKLESDGFLIQSEKLYCPFRNGLSSFLFIDIPKQKNI